MMKSNKYALAILVATMAVVSTPIPSLAQTKSKATIGIHTVEVTPAMRTSAALQGRDQVLSLERVSESMGQQLIDRVHNTRKFTVVSRSDLDTILKDQDLQRLLSDPSDTNIARAFKIAGCKYALIVTIDSFQDLKEQIRGEGGVVQASKRTIKLSSVLKIYDTTTAKLLESANFQLDDNLGQKAIYGATADGKQYEELLTRIARTMASKAANRVIDVIFPAKVIARTGNTVTVNRGDGTGIEKGQIWTVHALGEPLIDPDTGEDLGSEEIVIGTIKITSVRPKTAQGQVIEDYGIVKGQILRLEDNHQGKHDG